MAWDNTARRPDGAPTIFINGTPTRYQRWLSRLCQQAKSRDQEERLVFINAWNEWAEGVYLEPDAECGYAYINATRRALTQCDENVPRIAVVVHLFYWDLVDELAEYISNVPFPFDLRNLPAGLLLLQPSVSRGSDKRCRSREPGARHRSFPDEVPVPLLRLRSGMQSALEEESPCPESERLARLSSRPAPRQ
jgi:lipopolysaccharide biosynthesis protein